MKTTTYFLKVPLSVDSAYSGLSTALKAGYDTKTKTFVYFSVKVLHKYYENDQVRAACNIVKMEEIKSKKSVFPYNIKCPKEVGVGITLCLIAPSQTLQKNERAFFCSIMGYIKGIKLKRAQKRL